MLLESGGICGILNLEFGCVIPQGPRGILLEYFFPQDSCYCLEKEVAIHPSILAWEIPWAEEQSLGWQTVGHD